MKRMVAFIIIIFILLGISIIKDNLPQVEDFKKVVVVSNRNDLNLSENIIKNGNDFYYHLVDDNDFEKLKSLHSEDIKGIIYYFSNDLKLNYFEKKFKNRLSSKSIVENRTVFYGYDENYFDFRWVDSKKINFQLVNDGQNWILGYPMILNGF